MKFREIPFVHEHQFQSSNRFEILHSDTTVLCAKFQNYLATQQWVMCKTRFHEICVDDVIKWKHLPCYWSFVRGIHRSPVTQSFDVFFDLRLNKRLSKQSRGRCFETPPRPGYAIFQHHPRAWPYIYIVNLPDWHLDCQVSVEYQMLLSRIWLTKQPVISIAIIIPTIFVIATLLLFLRKARSLILMHRLFCWIIRYTYITVICKLYISIT